MRRLNEQLTHSVSGECSKHDGTEALVEGTHALLPDQLPQDVTEAVGVLSFRGCRAKQVSWVNTTAASQGLFITGSFNPKSDYLQDTRL